MSHASVSLQALFRLPETAALDPSLRALLEAHAGSGHEAIVLREPLPLLADTLESLSRLDADAEMMGAAVVFATGDWAASLMASLERKHPRVHALVDGLQASGQVWDLHAERGGSGNQEGLRRLLLAIVRDLRVVPILLAQQLARMRVAAKAPEAERIALARLTRDIHAPLANRLGIWQLKWELEDLAFRHLEPETYRRIAALLAD